MCRMRLYQSGVSWRVWKMPTTNSTSLSWTPVGTTPTRGSGGRSAWLSGSASGAWHAHCLCHRLPGAVAIDGSGRNGLLYLACVAAPDYTTAGGRAAVQEGAEGVLNATRGKQIPWEFSSLIGDFFFVSAPTGSTTTEGRDPSSGAATGASPGRVDPEVEMWHLIKDSTQIEDVLAFLSAFPNGRLAPVAQLKF